MQPVFKSCGLMKELILKGVRQWLHLLFGNTNSRRMEQLLDTVWQQYERLASNVETFQKEVTGLRIEICTLNRQLIEAEKLRCVQSNCGHRLSGKEERE